MLTWKCHVCGKERPDKFISVFKRDRSKEINLPAGSLCENIRYCNDNPLCSEGVKNIKLLDLSKDKSE